MLKVIFIGLLSISTCLSRPEETAATPPAAQTTLKDAVPVVNSTPQVVAPTTHENATSKTEPAVPPQASNATPPQNPSEATVPLPPKGSPTENKNTTTPSADNTTDNKAPKNETHVTPDDKNTKKNETVTPADNKANKTETTTLKPEPTPKPTAKTTEAPKATDIPPLQARGFDGPSFIGGIILTLGLLAIGFMGFKYYKNQTERNYHTL